MRTIITSLETRSDRAINRFDAVHATVVPDLEPLIRVNRSERLETLWALYVHLFGKYDTSAGVSHVEPPRYPRPASVLGAHCRVRRTGDESERSRALLTDYRQARPRDELLDGDRATVSARPAARDGTFDPLGDGDVSRPPRVEPRRTLSGPFAPKLTSLTPPSRQFVPPFVRSLTRVSAPKLSELRP